MAAGDATTQSRASPSSALSSPLRRSPSTCSPTPKLAPATGIPSPRTRAEDVWRKWEEFGAIQAGLLPASKLDAFLVDMRLSTSGIAAALEAAARQGLSQGLSLEQINAICQGLASLSRASSYQTAEGQASKTPLKKCLSKSREYLGTGYMVYDDSVVTYIRKLEEHRRKCEAEGRYSEAKAAASRLVDLKTAQVARMRQELTLVQTQELSEVHRVYEEETRKFTAVWEARLKDYQADFVRSVEEMRVLHQQQGEQFSEELSAKRPTKPQPSRDYLNNKKIEASLAKVKEYKRASHVKCVAAEMYQQELAQAQYAHEAEARLKLAKLVAKQRTEMEALMQRGVRGKSEMELRRAAETERRMYRFRNIVTELESLHKLEVVSLENFLDGQVLAGKATPLDDGFQRKREVLFGTSF